MERRRVVVTGIGAVNAVGNGVPDFLQGLREGRPGGAPITQFDATDSPVKIACEVKNFDPTAVLDKKTARRTDRYSHFAVPRPARRWSTRGSISSPRPTASACSIGSGIGGLNTLYTAHEHLFAKGIDRFSPFWVPALIPEHGRRLRVDRARHARPAGRVVHGLRGQLDGDRRRRHVHPRRAWPT